MPVVIHGGGTIEGIAVGGLPDGCVDADMLAANSVTSAKIVGSAVTSGKISGFNEGITGYDTWTLTADKNWSGTNYHNADWSRSTAVPTIGDAMTSSSGNMSFPKTGIWEVTFFGQTGDSTENAYTQIWIDVTTDSGSNWTTIANSTDAIADDGSNTVYGATCCSCTIDVTNTSTVQVRFGTANEQGAVFKGNATVLRNYAVFKRIGDT